MKHNAAGITRSVYQRYEELADWRAAADLHWWRYHWTVQTSASWVHARDRTMLLLIQTSSQTSFIYPPRLVHFPTQRQQRLRLEHAWICALYKFCNNNNYYYYKTNDWLLKLTASPLSTVCSCPQVANLTRRDVVMGCGDGWLTQ